MDRTNRGQLAQLILDVRYGREALTGLGSTSDLEYSSGTAIALIRASLKANPENKVFLDGEIDGCLSINGSVGGSLEIWGSVSEGISINRSGSIAGNLQISGSVRDLYIRGSVGGNLEIRLCGCVERGLDMEVSGSIDGSLIMEDYAFVGGAGIAIGEGCSIGENLSLTEYSLVNSGLSIRGSVGGNLTIEEWSSVRGDLAILGPVGGSVQVEGPIEGELSIGNSIDGQVELRSSYERRKLNPPSLKHLDELSKTATLRVGSFSGASFSRPVFLGEGVDLHNCDFRQFSGFEQLRFVGSTLFGHGVAKKISHTKEIVEWDLPDEQINDVELAGIYRQLRQVYERQSNRPEAGDFYYQEMNARRRASGSWRRPSWQWFVLWLYWVVSGYAQRTWRAVVCFFGLAAIATGLFLVDGFEPASTGSVWVRPIDALEFSIRSMVSFFNPPDGDLNRLERWGQLFIRFVGPAILAQAILAIREKVAR